MQHRLVDRLGLRNGNGSFSFAAHGDAHPTLHSLPELLGNIVVDRAGVRLFLGYAKLRQHVDNVVRGDFQLPCELVDSNFTHKLRQRP